MKYLFKFIAKVNKLILPSYINKDLSQLTKLDKLIVGYRYLIITKALE